MRNDELAHFGIIGMKWGVRRYQNKDGTLTALGRKRMEDKYGKGTPDKPWTDKMAKETLNKQIDQDWDDRKNALNAGANVANLAKKGLESANQKEIAAYKNSIDLSGYSNQELQAAISRYNLEQTYKDKVIEVKTGREKAIEFIGAVGEIAATGVTVLALITALNKFRESKSS